MNCPPTKRLRGMNRDIAMVQAFDDPFGDDEDFTQDDLDEIDILASQAITSTAVSGFVSKTGTKPVELGHGSGFPPSAGQSKPLSRATSNQSRENMCGFDSKKGNARIPSREPLGSRPQRFASDGEESYSLLEAQHADLKRKLKEVEEEIFLKSGEIRILRDSLKAAQQEKETQRHAQLALEEQRQREQSDREKELNKKVQALQTELQFKEAEINEMKTKLHSSDRNKMASPLPRSSPKVLTSIAQSHHGSCSSSSSPTGNGFITKEMFGALVPSRTPPQKTSGKTRRDDRLASSSKSCDKQEVPRQDPFLSVRLAQLQHRGGVLLGLLLQQPLSPSSLCLSHLLSTNIHLTSSGLSTGFLLHANAAGSEGGAPGAALSPVQSLAITGINMLSQSRPAAAASSNNHRSCPGAALLLPLLELHLSRLCQAMDSLTSTSAGTSGSDSTSCLPAAHNAAAAAGLGRLEENGSPGFSLEDTGLAVLRLLYLLLSHSDEVVEAVLSKESRSKVPDSKIDRSAAGGGLRSQNALLLSVLRLCDVGFGGGSSQREELVISAMKILHVLMERTPHTHTDRLQCVLQVLCGSVSGDSKLRVVSECVSVLMSTCEHPALIQQLCSQHDPCVFLKILQFIRIRPVSQTSHADLVLLDLQVVRLLSRLTQRAGSWSSSQHRSCQCYTEVVQTVVVVFHRQWLDLWDSVEQMNLTGLSRPHGSASSPWWRGPAASLLRECLQLLHWLLLHHGSFSESVRPLLHMYDQVIPAVRETLRKIPELSESEELALEEICRSEGDDTDDMDTDGS
ncbi:ATR-interacting protein [Aulostomus maculatus]